MGLELVDRVVLNETSLATPALAWGHGRLYLAWSGFTDHRLCLISSSGDFDFTGKQAMPFHSSKGKSDPGPLSPAVAATDTAVVVVFHDADQGLGVIRMPVGGPLRRVPTPALHLAGAPAVARWGQTLALGWRDGPGIRIAQLGDDGLGASMLLPDHRRVLLHGPPSDVAMCVVRDQLAIAWVGHDRRINLTFGRDGWFAPRSILARQATSSLGLTRVGDHVVIVWRNERGFIEALLPSTGQPAATLDIATPSIGGPAVCSAGDNVFIAAIAKGWRRRIQVARLVLRAEAGSRSSGFSAPG